MTTSVIHLCIRLRVGGALLVLTAAIAFCVGTSPASAAPLYPDIRIVPSDLRIQLWQGRYAIHFTTRTANLGEGPLEVNRTPTLSGIAELTQRIYESPAGFRDESLGQVTFRPTELGFPVPDFGRYEVWDRRAFARAQKSGFSRGQPVYVRDNVGHCIADIETVDPDAVAPAGRYRLCTSLTSGISVGWRNVESWTEPYQSVDLGTALVDGDYVLRTIVDPDNLLFESDAKSDASREDWAANSGIAYFRIAGGRLAGVDDF